MEAGFVIGFMGYLATLFTWWNMPEFLKRFTLNHPIITDAMVGVVLFYTMNQFSKSIASMVAAVVAGLLMNITTHTMAKPNVRAYLELNDPEPVPRKPFNLFFWRKK